MHTFLQKKTSVKLTKLFRQAFSLKIIDTGIKTYLKYFLNTASLQSVYRLRVNVLYGGFSPVGISILKKCTIVAFSLDLSGTIL